MSKQFICFNSNIVSINSIINELNGWLEDVNYEEMSGVLEELKGLKATLCSYLEDISRMEELVDAP